MNQLLAVPFMPAASPEALDAVLALQVTVAWGGEGLCDPQRLDWWRTDLIDKAGGGDMLQRLLPRTHQWASLEAVRGAAIGQDKQIRQEVAQSERIRTLFYWGFGIDEQLDDRLKVHKQSGKAPIDALPLPLELGSRFSRSDFEEAIRLPNQTVDWQVAPTGRELVGKMPEALELCAKRLGAGLLPLADRYPVPFYRVGGL